MTTLMTHSPVPPGSKSLSSSHTYTTSPTFSDQHSQLDDIISDLLSDRTFTTDQEDSDSIDQNGPQHGSITRHDGNNRTVVSWQKKASGPSRSITVSSHSVSRPSPNSRVESDCTRQQSMSVQRFPGGIGGASESASRYEEDHWAASDRYLYRTEETNKFEESKSEINKLNTMFAPTLHGSERQAPSAPRRLISYDGPGTVDSRQGPPYRKELADVLVKRSQSQNNKYSNCDDTAGMSWLDSQRAKLNQKREVRGYTSSRSYTAQSDAEDNRVLGRRTKDTSSSSSHPANVNSYDSLDELSYLLNESSRDLANTWQEQQQKKEKVQKYHQIQQRSSSVGAMRDSSQKAEPCFFVSGLEKPAFSKQHTKYVFSVSPSPSTLVRDESLEDKFNRSSCLSPPPPKRGDSSKEAVQRRNAEPKYVAPSVDELDLTLAKILAANNQSKPETDLIIEEEVISLEPIGRGIQILEPDTETLSRNRSRAPTPVYPGFPTSGYRSPSLSRMQGGFASPTPSGFRSPTPGRMVSPPVVNGPSGSSALDRSGTSTVVKAAYSSSTLNKSTDQERLPISPANNAINSPFQERSPSRLASKEEDLEEAVSFMMANAEPFKKTTETDSMNTSTSQQRAAFRNEVATGSSMVGVSGQHQIEPSSTLTKTTVIKSQQIPAASSLQDVNPTSQTAQTNLTYMEQQKSVLKQQQQLLLQSQQLQQLEQQEKELKEKQRQLEKELRQHQLLQQQQQANPSGTGRWTVKEETVTRTLNNSGNNDAFGNALVTSSSSSAQKQQQQKQQQQQASNVDLEQQMFEIEQHMRHDNTNADQGTLKQSSTNNHASTLRQQQQQQQQNGLINESYKQQNQSTAVQQLDDLSQQMKQLQEQNAEQQVTAASQQQQRQQAVTTKYGSQHNSSSAASSSGSFQAGTGHGLHGDEMGHSLSYARAPTNKSHQGALVVEESSSESKNGGSMMRSPSPSMWTSETLRSYTSRKHAGSASPLLPPGSTLPKHGRASPYFGQSRSGSISSINDMDTLNQIPRFVKDSSRLWHRPNITRDEAVSILKDKAPGAFIVRNSSTFQGAYGLALKVAQIPPNVQLKGGDPQTELVRHFLIEPTAGGVRLKGCSNEPVFSSLAALVYQHTVTPLALPCKLLLPDDIEVKFVDVTDASAGVLAQGAACNVLYLNSVDTESLTGSAAIATAIQKTFGIAGQPRATLVQFKVSAQGITLTDHQRSIFFRRHYPMNTVSYCGIDEGNENRLISNNEGSSVSVSGKVFGFVARKPGSLTENACHIFIESDPSQPASAIVDFMTKIMVGQGHPVKT